MTEPLARTRQPDGLFVKLEINIVGRDKSRARAWYAEKLGLAFDGDRADVGGVTLVLWQFPDATPASHTLYQFVTEDLEHSRETLKRRGVEVTEIDRDCWNFDFQDPDGNRLVMYEPRAWRKRRV